MSLRKGSVAPSKHFEDRRRGLAVELFGNQRRQQDDSNLSRTFDKDQIFHLPALVAKIPRSFLTSMTCFLFFSRFLKRDQLTYPWRIRCAYNIDMFLKPIHHVVSSFWWMLVMWTFIRHVLKITSNEETLIRRLRKWRRENHTPLKLNSSPLRMVGK